MTIKWLGNNADYKSIQFLCGKSVTRWAGWLTGFNLILAAARRSASIISLGPWPAQQVQVSGGVWPHGINHISRLGVCLTRPDKSLVFYEQGSSPAGAGESMEGNQLKMVSSVRLTDHEFFIEILILIPATWQSINNEIQSSECQMLKYLSALYPNSSKSYL